jgi:CBS domain-containing protein
MTVKVNELMARNVVSVTKHETVAQVKSKLDSAGLKTVPVVDANEEVVGILSATDLIAAKSDTTPISAIMTEDVYRIPQYSDVQIAARMMRNHRIHHLVVTHEQKLIGILSSFDLLKLVEDKRYVEKNPSTPKKNAGKRTNAES